MNEVIDRGQRRLAVDPAGPEAGAPAVNGERLKQERERRGMSTADAARLATLSREQIVQIEQGGFGAFYGPRHKLLAVRKYADAFGIDADELLAANPVPERPPFNPDMLSVIGGSAPDRQQDKRMQEAHLPASARSRLLTALALICAIAVLYSILRGLVPESAPPPAPSAALAPVEPPIAAPAPVVRGSSTTQSLGEPQDACSGHGDEGTVERWAPPLARRADTRLFLASATVAEVCVVDANGSPKRLKLTPGVTTSVAGKPPYLLRSANLARVQIYLQGLKVRVPPSAVALRVFAADSERPRQPAELASPES